MDYKVKNLYEKIYVAFIRGEYGVPKIPTKAEVIAKMESTTTQEYTPITTFEPKKDIDINNIRKNFSNIIDDIDVLFGSIEMESRDVLDQLTESLKEHNGVKRELRRIKSTSEDIANGKIGEEYLSYNFTETFDNSKFINTLKSDPVNYDQGIFTIRKDKSRVLSLSHYSGTKIEFGILENYARILDYGYVGSTDASLMLDQQDTRQLTYRIITNRPTRLRTAFSLQLLPDGRPVDINSIVIDVDSDIAKGFIRIYYKNSYKWIDVPGVSIQDIKNDKVSFNFSSIKTSHIKVEFIKDSPDVFETNTYYYIINNIAISQTSTKKTAVLYSKPIIANEYENEFPLVSSISVSGDLEIPKDTDIKLFVAQDIKISGEFVDSFGSPVDPDSPEAVTFDPDYSGYVFLSDIWKANDTVSGVSVYKGLDFNWKPLKIYGTEKEKELEKIEFENTKNHVRIENSLFSPSRSYLFGDIDYTGLYQLSGWVNIDNPSWSILEPYVASGVYVSGINIAADLGIAWEDIEPSGELHPDILADVRYSGQWIGYSGQVGYPFNYQLPLYNRTFRFNEYETAINGWWRPYSHVITSSGIDYTYATGRFLDSQYETTLPDFYFNNIPFYKIYKFNNIEAVIDPTIKLYTFQERPINSEKDYYPCNFVWKYRLKWIDRESSKTEVFDSRMLSETPPTGWQDYTITIPSDNLRLNEEYIVDSISEVRIHGTNFVLDNYQVNITDGIVTGIDLSSLVLSHPWLKPAGTTFDYKYKYRVKNEYLSTWTAFVIVSAGASNPSIQLSNIYIEGSKGVKLIDKIDIEDLNTGVIKTYLEDSSRFNIVFPSNQQNKGDSHYKITIYCMSDTSTGFCANNWVPFEASKDNNPNITVSSLVKIVQKLNPLKIVDISDLIYDTPMNNDNRAALITMENDEKFLVVKIPSKDTFPGYRFDSLSRTYLTNSKYMIENFGHWIRKSIVNIRDPFIGAPEDGYLTLDQEFLYTTGSSGLVVYDASDFVPDITWNDGQTLKDYPNTFRSGFYPYHSTIGYPINIDISETSTYTLYQDSIDPRAQYTSGVVGSTNWINWITENSISDYGQLVRYGQITVTDPNRGFLFYSTAENLPSFYSISYRTVKSIDDTNSRFLYKLQLTSDDVGSLVPKVRSIRFKINESI